MTQPSAHTIVAGRVMRLSSLLACAAGIGIDLEPFVAGTHSGSESDLYAWVTPQPGEEIDLEGAGVIYLGKHLNDGRVSEEQKWVDQARAGFGMQSGFAPTMAMHGIEQPVLLVRGETDLDRINEVLGAYPELPELDAVRARISGELQAVDGDLAGERGLTAAEVESILIQIVVRSGCLIANSAAAGLWDADETNWTSHLAMVAVAEHLG
jgi:hypothetical protein